MAIELFRIRRTGDHEIRFQQAENPQVILSESQYCSLGWVWVRQFTDYLFQTSMEQGTVSRSYHYCTASLIRCLREVSSRSPNKRFSSVTILIILFGSVSVLAYAARLLQV
jgi:hypothetical protein